MRSLRPELERIWRAGVAACLPERVLPPHLPEPDTPVRVLALGKAAAGMALIAEQHFARIAGGVAVVPHGTAVALERLPALAAGHPLPDTSSVAAARRLLDEAGQATNAETLLVLLSGGGSALACLPGRGLSLATKQSVTEALLRSGASIGEINCVRRHLSAIKGGRLALAAGRARLLTLAISDVPGDRPEDIASGPTVADPTTLAEARAVLERYDIAAPGEGWSETAKSVEGEFRIVARSADAVAAAAAEARRLGYRPRILGESTGEASEVGRAHAALALAAAPGTALISGGELTVKLRGGGRGGRNHEYALAAALALDGRPGLVGLAGDSDGIDGGSGAAGAFFGDIPARGGEAALAANDSAGWFAERGGQWVTGPTGTNVNDLRIILVAP